MEAHRPNQKPSSIETQLASAFERRKQLIATLGSERRCLRLINGDADGFDGLTVDRYGPALLVEQHRVAVDAEPLLDALSEHFGRETAIFFKRRCSRREEDRAGGQVRGAPRSPELEVEEEGLRFEVHLSHGEHTGLFLDSRPARALVRRVADQRRVLNLFSYTGSMGVAAASGAARSTTNIDVKRSALERARRNYTLNALPVDTRTFLKTDAFQHLNRTARGRGRYDLVIVDPPPRFRRPGGRRFDARDGYGRLIARCLPVIAPGGLLLAGLCTGVLDDASFEGILAEVSQSSRVTLRPMEHLDAGVDFPAAGGRPTARMVLCEVTAEI